MPELEFKIKYHHENSEGKVTEMLLRMYVGEKVSVNMDVGGGVELIKTFVRSSKVFEKVLILDPPRTKEDFITLCKAKLGQKALEQGINPISEQKDV